MGRTESKSIQCHPNNEQEQINLMQKFHWSLIGSQEIKTVDNHLERRGDEIYQVRSSEHYVKLTFSRELELPNLNEIKKLEDDYFGLPSPYYPKLFPIHIGVWGVLALLYGLGIVIWLLYYFLSYKKKKAEADRISESNAKRRQEILSEVAKFS